MPQGELLIAAIPFLLAWLSGTAALRLSTACHEAKDICRDHLTVLSIRLERKCIPAQLRFIGSFSSLLQVRICGCRAHEILSTQDIASLASLPLLQQLQMEDCWLESLAPISSLFNLRCLSLSKCSLSSLARSTAPDLCRTVTPYDHMDTLRPLSTLKKLEHLTLRSCFPITDKSLVHTSGLCNLKLVDLSYCSNIAGPGLGFLLGASDLHTLVLRGCKGLTETCFSSLASLTALQHLDMTEAGKRPSWLSWQPFHNYCWRQLSTLRNLQHIDVKDLSAQHLPATLSRLQHAALGIRDSEDVERILEMESLQTAELRSAGPAHPAHKLSGLTRLQWLDLSGMWARLPADVVRTLAPCLRELRMSGHDASLETLAALSTLTSLRKLRLDSCQLSVSHGLQQISRLVQLQQLCCSAIGDEGMACLSPLTSLQCLHLQTEDAGLACLAGLQMLTELDMTHSFDLWHARLCHISALQGLRKLCLAQTEITDAGLASLAVLTALESIDLSYCTRLDGSGLAHLAEIGALTRLNLRRCIGLREEGLRCVTLLTGLMRLSLEMYDCDGLNSMNMAFMSVLSNLEDLDVTGATCKTVSHVCQALPGLLKLRLDAMGWNGSADHLMHLVALTHLKLCDNYRQNLRNDTIAHMAMVLTRLHKITLDCCTSLTDKGLTSLVHFPYLHTVKLRRCAQVSDGGVARLSGALECIRVVLN